MLDVTPSAVHIGNIVQGIRLASAQGRDIGILDSDDGDVTKKVSDRQLCDIVNCMAVCHEPLTHLAE